MRCRFLVCHWFANPSLFNLNVLQAISFVNIVSFSLPVRSFHAPRQGNILNFGAGLMARAWWDCRCVSDCTWYLVGLPDKLS
jgi:hypothetical protein